MVFTMSELIHWGYNTSVRLSNFLLRIQENGKYQFTSFNNSFEGITGEKDEGFAGTVIKDTWTTTRRGGNGREVGRAGVVGRGGGKGRKLYLNNNKKKLKKKLLKDRCSERDIFTKIWKLKLKLQGGLNHSLVYSWVNYGTNFVKTGNTS